MRWLSLIVILALAGHAEAQVSLEVSTEEHTDQETISETLRKERIETNDDARS